MLLGRNRRDTGDFVATETENNSGVLANWRAKHSLHGVFTRLLELAIVGVVVYRGVECGELREVENGFLGGFAHIGGRDGNITIGEVFHEVDHVVDSTDVFCLLSEVILVKGDEVGIGHELLVVCRDGFREVEGE